QDVTGRELGAGVAAAKAAGGAALVLDPSTGEVLALANVPTFDPNQPARRGDRAWRDRVRNRAITDPYEPGSTFKAILAAAAIEERVVRPTDSFFCENGRYRIGRWRIHDSHPHGWLSFAQVIQYSSNIGAIANGGVLVRPFLVRRVLTPDGDVVLEKAPVVVRRVVSTRTAQTVTALLRRAVEEKGGTGEQARLDDFPVAGKTGTAQKVN